eukprot:2465691-Alexandrium_andersonii.AAC.1
MLETGTGLDIKAFLMNKHRLLDGFDRWWQIERDFGSSIVGQPGEQKLTSMVLDVVPSASKPVLPADALLAIEGIEKCKLYEFVGIGCQTVVPEVAKIVRGIAGNRPP